MEFSIVGRRRFKIGTIVRLTGFSQALLRTWERRYGILSPERGPGNQRLYSEDDLRLLRTIREHLNQGRTIGEIVLHGRASLLEQGAPAGSPDRSVRPSAEQIERSRKHLVDAALALDSAGMNQALDEASAMLASDALLAGVIESAARDLGELWERGRCTVAAEHIATNCFLLWAAKLYEGVGRVRHVNPAAVVACLPGEYHSLGSLMLSYYLVRSGFQVSYFGAALPMDDLETACSTITPRMVCLSVAQPRLLSRSRRRLLEFLRRWRGRTRVLLGGWAVPAVDNELTGLGATLWPKGRSVAELLNSPLLHSADAWLKLKE